MGDKPPAKNSGDDASKKVTHCLVLLANTKDV